MRKTIRYTPADEFSQRKFEENSAVLYVDRVASLLPGARHGDLRGTRILLDGSVGISAEEDVDQLEQRIAGADEDRDDLLHSYRQLATAVEREGAFCLDVAAALGLSLDSPPTYELIVERAKHLLLVAKHAKGLSDNVHEFGSLEYASETIEGLDQALIDAGLACVEQCCTHASDCALHRGPAEDPGPCSCPTGTTDRCPNSETTTDYLLRSKQNAERLRESVSDARESAEGRESKRFYTGEEIAQQFVKAYQALADGDNERAGRLIWDLRTDAYNAGLLEGERRERAGVELLEAIRRSGIKLEPEVEQ